MTDLDLARLLAKTAAVLDQRGDPLGGIVRRGARALLDGPAPSAGGCRGCGGPVPVRATGRPRVWCGEACRRKRRP